jgi:serine protease
VYYAATVPSWRDFFGSSLVTYPALGTVDIPFAAAPDLAGPNRFVAPRDFIWNDTDPLDFDGHGTHVAGTIGQLTNNGIGVAGMAFNVRIMPVKVIDSMWDDILGSPFEGTDDVVARGVHYAVDNGANVLNMSIGRSGAPSPLLQEAITYATSHGAFVAIAAGNDFERGNPTQWPAAYAPSIQGAVAVGATGRDRQRAYYSSTGPFVEAGRAGWEPADRGNDRRHRAADVRFRVRRYVRQRPGTRTDLPRSTSSRINSCREHRCPPPHVAGFAALLMQQGITSPAAVEAAMEQFATDLGAAGVDQQYGYGLINPRASLRGLGLAK